MKNLLILVLFTVGSWACSHAQTTQNLNAKAFKETMTKTPNKIILDVRTNSEVAQGVIAGALQIDYNNPHFEHQLEQLDKSKPIFVYCAIGGRSGSAAQLMQKKGFKKIYNLDGGINAWQRAGYPITSLKK
ncbi:rhodanese-like domain-containing protein [Runella sp. MFBS21]|uniref:rhodanese-like domain-containing protein n=1 Tax=Runella sp. MFBS21 TaxID=3034018 RepID=UPI0023F8AC67|nr:rhodanese-like domain-containing protein [Runella sp. MFBS21]MDF7820059.1 rhodanese-like domain-containing protein [Runella sp. MFBS21]